MPAVLQPTRRSRGIFLPLPPNAPLSAGVLSFVYSTINAIRINSTPSSGGTGTKTADVYRGGVLQAANQTFPYDDSSVSVDTLYVYSVVFNDSLGSVTSNSVTCALPWDGASLGSGSGSRITGIMSGGAL